MPAYTSCKGVHTKIYPVAGLPRNATSSLMSLWSYTHITRECTWSIVGRVWATQMHGLANQGFTSIHNARGQPSLSCLILTFTKPLRKSLHMLNTQPSTNVNTFTPTSQIPSLAVLGIHDSCICDSLVQGFIWGGQRGNLPPLEFTGTPTHNTQFFVPPPLNKMSKCSPAECKGYSIT